GGKTQSANGEVANGVDGAGQTRPDQTSAEQQATEDSTTTTGNDQSTVEPNPPTASPPTVTPLDDTTQATESPISRPVATGETTGETAVVTTSAPSVTSDVTESMTTLIDAGSLVLACEFGSPQQFCLNSQQMESQARYGVGQIPLDPPRSDEEIAAAWDDNGCMRHEWVATGCCNPAELPGEPQGDGTCCYVACEGACCGRPFLVNGVALTAKLTRNGD